MNNVAREATMGCHYELSIFLSVVFCSKVDISHLNYILRCYLFSIYIKQRYKFYLFFLAILLELKISNFSARKCGQNRHHVLKKFFLTRCVNYEYLKEPNVW